VTRGQQLLLGLIGVALPAWATDVPRVRNGNAPAEGVQTWQLSEQWRAGGTEDEHVFGLVSQAAIDPQGNVYLLDQQLCQVLVYSPDGRRLRVLGGEGDGPGEFRMPWDMTLLPGGRIGVGLTMPGKIVVLENDGTPAGTIPIGNPDPAAGGFHVLDQVKCRGEHLAVVARTVEQDGDALIRRRYLSILDFEGREKVRLLEDSSPDAILQGKYIERDDYFVNLGRWALGPDGTVFAAPHRDRYAVSVFSPAGELIRIIEREFDPWKRSAAEKARVGEGMIAIIDGEQVRLEVEAEDHAPCISSLHAAANGDLWVLSARGTRDQPPGVLRTFDVFDPQGKFVRQVAIALEDGDPAADRLFLLDGDRMLVIKNYGGSVRGMTGSGAEDDESTDPTPLEIICCRIQRP